METSEYLPMFLAEGREHLQELNLAVVRIEETPDDQDTVDEIFRIAHSLKGMSATMGFAGMAALTHEMEDVFELLRQRRGGLSRDAIDCLLQCLDALSAAVDAIDDDRRRGDRAGSADRDAQGPDPRRGRAARGGHRGAARRRDAGQPVRAGRRPSRRADLRDAARGRADAVRARLHAAVGDRQHGRDAGLHPVARRRRHLQGPRDRRVGRLRAHRLRAGRGRRARCPTSTTSRSSRRSPTPPSRPATRTSRRPRPRSRRKPSRPHRPRRSPAGTGTRALPRSASTPSGSTS